MQQFERGYIQRWITKDRGMCILRLLLLQTIKLPSTATEIDYNAFFGCNNLRKVRLNDGLQKVGDSAFGNCELLENIKLPSTVTEIGINTFRSCRNLRVVTLNDGLQKIGNYAFCNCTSLQRITIPSTVTEIGDNAFGSCLNMMEVELNGVPQYLHNEAFHNCDALEKFLFPTLSYRLGNIIPCHWEELEDKLYEVRGVVQWESDKLFVSRATHDDWDDISIRRDFGKIAQLVSYYELKEATSTFELALWKSNLDQADATNANHTNRAAYRIDVPGPVKDTILQYLLAIPRYKIFSIEKTTSAFGELVIMNVETGDMINFMKNPMLDMSILENEKWKIIGSEDIEVIIVVEKASIYQQMIQTNFHKRLKAILITDRGFPTLLGKAWTFNIRKMLSIDESKCFGVADYGPYGWALLHAYYYVKDPIEGEKVLGTRLRIAITPALMPVFNFEVSKWNTDFNLSDLNIFKFLLDENNKFFEHNGKVRMNQLIKMYRRSYKCDLDALDIEELLEALEIVIKSGKTV